VNADPLDLSHLSIAPVANPQLELLKDLAVDIGSSVVIRERRYLVDGLSFDSLEAAIRHCQEIA